MTDEQEFKFWQSWGDVPDEVKTQLIQGPFPKQGPALSAGDSFYDALRKIIAAL